MSTETNESTTQVTLIEWAVVVAGLALFVASAYAAYGRLADSMLWLLAGVYALAVQVLSRTDASFRPQTWYDWIATSLSVPFGAAYLTYGALLAAADVAQWLLTRGPIYCGVAVLCAGLLAYRIRVLASAIYGLVEVGLGVWIGAQRLVDVDATPLLDRKVDIALAALTAGVYLVVRGLDNVDKGLNDAKRRDRCIDFLRAQIESWRSRRQEQLSSRWSKD